MRNKVNLVKEPVKKFGLQSLPFFALHKILCQLLVPRKLGLWFESGKVRGTKKISQVIGTTSTDKNCRNKL